MKYYISLFVCVCVCAFSAYSQSVQYQHYFNPTSQFESDTFSIQFACDLSYPQFADIDSVVVTHYKLVNRSYVSFNQTILQQTIVPNNCAYYILGESLDTYGNTLQTIVVHGIQQATFGLTISYQIAGKTIFQGFNDCPFDVSVIQSLPSSITQYLQATNQMQSEHPEIIALAQQLSANCVTIADIVESIVKWNNENVSYDFTFNHDVQDALSVLHNKTALCEGYTNLTCALLRSLGIPARFVSGFAINDQFIRYSYAKGSGGVSQAEGGHAWVEVYYPSIGAWVPTEPQALANFITPAYVPVKNTISYTDNIQVRSQIPTITGTKSASFKGADSDTIYYSTQVLTLTEPIDPHVQYEPLLTLEVGRAHGCNTASVLPDVAQYIQGNYVVCESAVQTYKVPKIPGATSYEWILPNGSKQITADTILNVTMDKVFDDGVLQVQGVNSQGKGIAAQLPLWITLLPQAFTLTGPDEVCKGHANAEFFIQSTGATPHWTILPGTSGTYTATKLSLIISQTAQSGTIEVYGSNSCGNGPTSSIQVAVKDKTPLPKLVDDSLHVCFADDQLPLVQLQNPYGTIYWLYDGQELQQQTLSTAKPALNTPISFKVYQHQVGCSQSDTTIGYVYVGQELQEPVITLLTDSTLNVSTIYSYVWFANAVEFSQQTQTIQPTQEAEFYVLATDEHQCSVRSNTIEFTPPVPNQIAPIKQTKDYTCTKVGSSIHITPANNESITCTLYSITGEIIETKKGSSLIQFSLYTLPKTIYFVEIGTEQGVFVERFVK